MLSEYWKHLENMQFLFINGIFWLVYFCNSQLTADMGGLFIGES